MTSNNMSIHTPIGSTIMLSLIDFTQQPPSNVFIEWRHALERPVCTIYPTTWLPPMNAEFLRQINAVYTGEEITASGVAERWSFMMFNTSFTFYFNVEDQTFLGYDFFSQDPEQGAVGVKNRFTDVRSSTNASEFEEFIFSVPKECPEYTKHDSPKKDE
jgi:hypothetical protein